MPTQRPRRLGITGPPHDEQSSKRQNLVAVAQASQGPLGQTLEEEICAKCGGKEPNSMEWGQPWLLNMDSGQAEQTAGYSACLLGNQKWGNNSLLERFLATMASFRQ
jgi:hypothetical protein